MIAARGLAKRYGKVVALDGVDLDVPRGSAFGLLGPTASGTSTIVRLLAGLARPTKGTLTIGGAPAGSIAARRQLGVLLQDAPMYAWMRGRDVLAFAADLAGIKGTRMAERVGEVAGRFGLQDALDRRVADAPADVRGRLGIAQAIVGDPDVLVLDEPFHWLDPEARELVLGVLARFRVSNTIVLAAHRWPDVHALCDSLVVLDSGRVAYQGATSDLAARMAPVYVVQMASTPGLALAGVVARLRAEPWVTDATATGGTLRVAVSDADRAARELLPALVGAGVPVAALRREEGSLARIGAGLPRP